MSYDLKSVDLPRLAGGSLSAVARLAESRWPGSLVRAQMIRTAGLAELRQRDLDAPLALGPVLPRPGGDDARLTPDDVPHIGVPDGNTLATVRGIALAYRSGITDPVEVAERVIKGIERSESETPHLRTFVAWNVDDIRRQAEASAQRFKIGAPLSLLDGVPVPVKDELDQVPYPTTVGTRIHGKTPATRDATVVARLRGAGAMLIGKTNMHEIGIGVTGINPHHGAARNPYGLDRITGGSSSGSAAAVAAGFGPIAVGADGGGSIRIPAALCGVVGLKPTYGRVSEHGATPLCWSVAHVGPIGLTTHDCAVGYAVMAGVCPHDAQTRHQPDPTLRGLDDKSLEGVRIGVFRPWFKHADTEVVTACYMLLGHFERRGAKLVEIELEDLNLIRLAHLVTIATEMATSQSPWLKHRAHEYGGDTRVNLALTREFTADDYARAQRVRAKACAMFAERMKDVDVIATPATACVAQPIHEGAERVGESDLNLLDRLMRFAVAANLTGLPAISFPAGYDSVGLPIGLQLMGRPWEEALLLRLSAVSEEAIVRQPPRFRVGLLS